MQIRIAEQVVEQLQALHQWHSEQVANRITHEILDAIDRLVDMPEMAPIEQLLDDMPEHYRSLVVSHRYKVIYFIENDTIYVTAIADCKRSPFRLLRLFRKQH